MNEQLEFSHTMQDIVEKIIKKMLDQRVELEEALKNPKFMTFLVINSSTNLEEKIRYYDPLYSNNFIRSSKPNDNIHIKIRVEANEEMSHHEKGIIIKKSGYAKFQAGENSTEWRECKVKETGRADNIAVKFKSCVHPCKIIQTNFSAL